LLRSNSAQRDCQSNTNATEAATSLPTKASSPASSAPSAHTSSKERLVSIGPCGTIALWNFSAPARDARHWKKQIPSAPRARAW
jgi:hypothetical protein